MGEVFLTAPSAEPPTDPGCAPATRTLAELDRLVKATQAKVNVLAINVTSSGASGAEKTAMHRICQQISMLLVDVHAVAAKVGGS